MQKVWVVTAGEYSDYRIKAIFSTRTAAESYCAELHKESASNYEGIEEHHLDEQAGAKFIKVHRMTIFLDGGKIVPGNALGVRPEDEEIADPVACSIFVQDSNYITVASPISPEHAEKVAVEKRQEWLRSRVPA